MKIETVWTEEGLDIHEEDGELVLLAVPFIRGADHHHFTLTASGEADLLAYLQERNA
jgi:hypothetical protein